MWCGHQQSSFFVVLRNNQKKVHVDDFDSLAGNKPCPFKVEASLKSIRYRGGFGPEEKKNTESIFHFNIKGEVLINTVKNLRFKLKFQDESQHFK